MIRTRLAYHAPSELDEACGVLAEHGEDAAVLGGGTMLLPSLTRGERTAHHVVDLRRLRLGDVVAGDGEVQLGARATYADLVASALLRDHAPLLPIAASGITGGPQIRNLASLGGSACYANPASDGPTCLVALRARMRVHGPTGPREVAAEDFFVDAFRTALRPGEILVGFALPHVTGPVGYHKLKLCESSWAIVTGAAVVHDASAAVTLGGAGRRPVRIELDGADGVRRDPDALDALVAERLGEPYDDELAPGSYRQAVAGAVARRALAALDEERTR